jgi:hypothetical protein
MEMEWTEKTLYRLTISHEERRKREGKERELSYSDTSGI